MTLLDTNILVFAHNIKSPQHQKAKQLVQDALDLKLRACLAHQNLLEFFSIITNSQRVEKPLELKEAFSLIQVYLFSNKIVKIYPSLKTLSQTVSMAKAMSISKAEIFDCYLVETMLEHNILTIYTENASHFKRYKNIKAVNPF